MQSEIGVRTARPGDAPFISELLAQLGYPATAEDIPARLSLLETFPRALALVAADGDQVVGLVTAHIIPSIHSSAPIALLTTLVVGLSHRGRGIGSELVSKVELWAAENGALRVSVTSGLQRVGTHDFYERRKYERTGLRFTKIFVATDANP